MDGGVSHSSMIPAIAQVCLSQHICLPKQGKGQWSWFNPRVKDTRRLHSVVNREKGRSLWGCSGSGTSATSSPKRSRRRFWDQLQNALQESIHSRKHQTPVREVAPHFETDGQLQCVRKPDSKQTDSCQKGSMPSFFFTAETWILGQGSPCIGAESALGKPGTTVWVLQPPSTAKQAKGILCSCCSQA